MAKTSTPFFSTSATGTLAGVLAAVHRKNHPTTIRRTPTTTKTPSALQLTIRNAHAMTLAALRFASLNASPARPYTADNRPIWRTLATASNLWQNIAQRRFAALAYTGNTPDYPAWFALPAATRAAWDAAATMNALSIPPVVQQAQPPATPYTLPGGRALLAHELSLPPVPGQNPPDANYPPIYNPAPGPYTRAFWDFARTPWDGDAYLWDAMNLATWDTPTAPPWDNNAAIWDAR